MHLFPIVLSLAGCLHRATPARCSCMPLSPVTTPADAAAILAEESGAVFEGRVIATRLKGDSTLLDSASARRWPYRVLVATVRVTRRWSPGVADSVHVETMEQTTMCGMDLVSGGRYLFVAQRSAEGEAGRTTGPDAPAVIWSVSKCGYSRPWDREARRLARLFSRSRPHDEAPGRTRER